MSFHSVHWSKRSSSWLRPLLRVSRVHAWSPGDHGTDVGWSPSGDFKHHWFSGMYLGWGAPIFKPFFIKLAVQYSPFRFSLSLSPSVSLSLSFTSSVCQALCRRRLTWVLSSLLPSVWLFSSHSRTRSRILYKFHFAGDSYPANCFVKNVSLFAFS